MASPATVSAEGVGRALVRLLRAVGLPDGGSRGTAPRRAPGGRPGDVALAPWDLRPPRSAVVRGVEVHLGDLAAATRSLPGVDDVLVGVESGRLVAAVAPRGGVRLDERTLRAGLVHRVPVAWVPSRIDVLAAGSRSAALEAAHVDGRSADGGDAVVVVVAPSRDPAPPLARAIAARGRVVHVVRVAAPLAGGVVGRLGAELAGDWAAVRAVGSLEPAVPSGPLAVVGQGSAAEVAVDLAARLDAVGRDVVHLALVDPPDRRNGRSSGAQRSWSGVGHVVRSGPAGVSGGDGLDGAAAEVVAALDSRGQRGSR